MLSQDFSHLLEEFLKERMNREGQVVKGKVVSIDKDMAIIDVKLKSEGRVPLKEFLPANIVVGDEVDVFIDRYEGVHGDVQLSHERALQEASWGQITESFKSKKPVEGLITNQVKGGLTVDIGGTIAFLPGSQVDIRPVKDLSNFVNTTQLFIVLKMDDSRSNVVVSRRAVLEESRSAGRQHLLSTLQQGQRLEGVVKNLTDYGAFVDLGGIDGLLHITDIAWKRIQHPSEVLSVGQAIPVMVVRFNKETQRISLGMKQLEKDPWVNVHERFKAGDKVKGTVTNVTDYGAFVEMDDGLEGLIYVAEMVWSKKNVDPSQIVKSGQEITAMILEIDSERRRISLGLKQCTENPLEKFAVTHPINSEIEGEIKDITEFGLLIQLTEVIDGTIHRSDLSWEPFTEEISNKYSIGSRIRMKVLSVNPEREMIGLGVKQLTEDPWVKKFANIKKGQSITGKVSRIFDNGIEIDLGDNVKTTINRADLSRTREEQNPHRFTVDEQVEAKVVALNLDTHHILLSIKAQEIEDERDAMTEYGGIKDAKSSLGSILEAALDSKTK